MPRTIAITGATDGLGRALALRLAGDDVRLVLHGRSAERLSDLVAELGPVAAHPPLTVRADLADLAQVARAADEIAGQAGELHVLLTEKLLPLLRTSAGDTASRIVNVASGAPDPLAVDPGLDGITGRFYDRLTPAGPHRQAGDPAARATLRERSLELVAGHLA